MVLQLQGCVTEKKQTVVEFTLRTLKEIPWTDLTSYFKILHPTEFLGLEDRLALKMKVLQLFDTPLRTSIYQSTRRKNKQQSSCRKYLLFI